jgi:hypothetical protein
MSREKEEYSKKNQEEESRKVTLLLRNSNNIRVTIVRTNSDDRNQDEADRLRSQQQTTNDSNYGCHRQRRSRSIAPSCIGHN